MTLKRNLLKGCNPSHPKIRRIMQSKIFNIILFMTLGLVGIIPSINQAAPVEKVTPDPRISWGKARLESLLMEYSDSLADVKNHYLQIEVAANKADLPVKARHQEGFQIIVREGQITIRGFDPAGALYGCLELKRIIKDSGKIPEKLKTVRCAGYEFTGDMHPLDEARNL